MSLDEVHQVSILNGKKEIVKIKLRKGSWGSAPVLN